MTDEDLAFDEIRGEFERNSGLTGVNYKSVTKPNGNVLVLDVSYPTERLFRILENARASVASEGDDPPLATLRRRKGRRVLEGPESRLLLRVLAENQNINRYSFQDDFMARYTKSVSGAEAQIIAQANHIVMGRRGAGKSMLLLYAWHERRLRSAPSVWVDMQLYSGRDDDGVVAEVLTEILEQTSDLLKENDRHREIQRELRSKEVGAEQIRLLLPRIHRLLKGFADQGNSLFVFLDDFTSLERHCSPCSWT